MKSLFKKFQHGLQKTAVSLSRGISGLFSDSKKWSVDDYEDLETALISSDFGVNVTTKLVENIRERYELGEIKTSEDLIAIAKGDISEILDKNNRDIAFNKEENMPTVILLVGVNGSGKTTTAGKMAHRWKQEGKKVMLAACDTFRAAAVDQLKLWGERTGCSVVAAQHGADPAAVAFDAVTSAKSRGMDILIIDTAGRQHNNKGLMDELAKIYRTIDKVCPGAPHEVWLTVDSSLGGNALMQTKEFLKSANLTGLVLTKLDGTGKGGMAVAIQNEFPLPVFFVGLGEQLDDLQPFDTTNYINALFSSL
jgi:fused signal recognition particle receptor